MKWQILFVYLKRVSLLCFCASCYVFIAPANECPEDIYLNRHVVPEVAAACAYQPDVWRALGIELLGQDGIVELDGIKADNENNTRKCCSVMLTLWRQRQTSASWNQLLKALQELKLNRIAADIEKYLESPTEQEEKVVNLIQAMEITPTQQQQIQQAKQDKEESSKASYMHDGHLIIYSQIIFFFFYKHYP